MQKFVQAPILYEKQTFGRDIQKACELLFPPTDEISVEEFDSDEDSISIG